jgi:hypothetical protein
MKTASIPSGARRVLLLSVVLAGVLAAASIVQWNRALRQQYEEAQERAVLYARTVFPSVLVPEDVTAPPEGEQLASLTADVKRFVLADPLVARVRLWQSNGTLLFSTDGAELAGDTSADPAIVIATDGRVESRLAVEQWSPPREGAGRRATPLFQTFAPLLVPGFAGRTGAVEVEQFADALKERADDPWWIVQAGASGLTVLLALLALVSVARGIRRSARGTRSSDLDPVEPSSHDERVDELTEALRRSESERAVLPAERSETLLETAVRELRRQLRESEARAKAAEALVEGGGDLSAVQEELASAARQVEEAVERTRNADERADAADDRARAAGDVAAAADTRIELLEAKLEEIAAEPVGTVETPELKELQRELAEARQRAHEMEERAVDAEGRLSVAGSLDGVAGSGLSVPASLNGPSEEFVQALEDRLVAAEAKATETEARVRSVEEQASEGGSRLRQQLGIMAARKLVGSQPEAEPEMDLRMAIARGLRGPLTRASGLTLSLQGTVESVDGKAALRQLSSSLRRLDQLAADLHDVHRIIDGSIRLNRRRTDLAALMTATLEGATYLDDRLVRLDADTVYARVDPARARQIVEGMLDAARERTRSSSAIVVRVRDTDAGARISVEDDNRSPITLGPELSLAVRLAELHGGKLTVDGSFSVVVFPKVTRT